MSTSDIDFELAQKHDHGTDAPSDCPLCLAKLAIEQFASETTSD